MPPGSSHDPRRPQGGAGHHAAAAPGPRATRHAHTTQHAASRGRDRSSTDAVQMRSAHPCS
eukprot:7682732-Alexandrium_andersonii.AAC.1